MRIVIIGATTNFDAAATERLGKSFDVAAAFVTLDGVLDELSRIDPHVVLLDVTNRAFDGLAALQLILAVKPAVAVVVMMADQPASTDLGLRCLSRGAAAEIVLPPRGRGRAAREMRDAFLETLAAKINTVAVRPRARISMVLPQVRPPQEDHAPRCIVIGASTGGPHAVATVLKDLGPCLARHVPIVVLQHMPPILIAGLASQLGALCGCKAGEAVDGEPLRPGTVYVAPGDRHLRLRMAGGEVVAFHDDGPPINSCKPSADLLLSDAAAVYGRAVLAIILTGMGQDGLEGAAALSAAGAPILVQDEKTSTVWGMPGSVARAGLATAVLPLDEIAAAARAYWPESIGA